MHVGLPGDPINRFSGGRKDHTVFLVDSKIGGKFLARGTCCFHAESKNVDTIVCEESAISAMVELKVDLVNEWRSSVFLAN